MARVKKYDWGIDKPLPLIEHHSLIKLNIIERYLETYIRHLTLYPFTKKLKFAIVDGFCGGGLYVDNQKNEIYGSPLRILNVIENIPTIINIEREKQNLGGIDFDIDVILIEKDLNTYKFLQKTMQDRDLQSSAKLYNVNFQKSYLKIISDLKNKKYNKAIFILDQYGYIDANILTIKNILAQFKNAEVILTFACDSLIDYLAEDRQANLVNLGLDKYHREYLLDTKREDDKNRNAIRKVLLDSIIQKVGACFYTPFFIKGTQTHRAYWLLHFSNHPIARNEMVKLHYENYNSFIHYGGSGLDMFGYSSKDEETFKPFLFAQEDKDRSLKLVAEQIGEKITQYNNKTFGEFIRNEINHTPATIEIVQESLKEYLRCGDIEIIDIEKNKKIKNYKDIKLENLIRVPKIRQGRFNF